MPQRSPAHFLMGLEKGKRALEWMQAGMGGERNAVTELCTTAGCTRATLLLCAVLQGWPACRVGLRALCRSEEMGDASSGTHGQMWKCKALSAHSISQDTSSKTVIYFFSL